MFRRARKPFKFSIDLLEIAIDELQHERYEGKIIDAGDIQADLESAIHVLKKEQKRGILQNSHVVCASERGETEDEG